MAAKRVGAQITWSAPPPAKGRGGGRNHREIALALRENPGEWADIGAYGTWSSAYCAASFIRRAQYKAYTPARSYQATVAFVEGQPHVFARFMGEVDAAQ